MNLNDFDFTRPTHVFNESQFELNLMRLNELQRSCGLRVLLALKGYNPAHSNHLVNEYLTGVAVSSQYEAQCSSEVYNGEIHTYLPAYDDTTFDELMKHSSHVVFNSHQDLERFAHRVPPNVKIDIRVNIQHENTQAVVFDGYNPNLPRCRFGITMAELKEDDIEKYNVTGIHFHALNSQGSGDLSDACETLERKFGHILHKVERLNMGGGHKICHPDYDYELLESIVTTLRRRYKLDAIYIEPSEYVYTGVGVLKARVLSILQNEGDIAILNVSAKNHMPDILESPYYYAEMEEGRHGRGEDKYVYTLGGNTCLTGDVIGDYSFPEPLQVGQILTFIDQTAYTTVQSQHFNGVAKPDLLVINNDGQVLYQKIDSYETYRSTL